jgi:ElaB/YqjD/DUF883 family membrane-anchored ribosome-binding protein
VINNPDDTFNRPDIWRKSVTEAIKQIAEDMETIMDDKDRLTQKIAAAIEADRKAGREEMREECSKHTIKVLDAEQKARQAALEEAAKFVEKCIRNHKHCYETSVMVCEGTWETDDHCLADRIRRLETR